MPCVRVTESYPKSIGPRTELAVLEEACNTSNALGASSTFPKCDADLSCAVAYVDFFDDCEHVISALYKSRTPLGPTGAAGVDRHYGRVRSPKLARCCVRFMAERADFPTLSSTRFPGCDLRTCARACAP